MFLLCLPLYAYQPGTGNLLSENFDDGDDAGWLNGLNGAQSTWQVALRSGSQVYAADGIPDPSRPLPEATRHLFHPVYPGSLDLCFRLVAAGGTGYLFTADLRPPRDDALVFYRMLVRESGRAEAAYVRGAGTETLASTANGAVAAGVPTWIRLRIRPGALGASDISLRVWTGGASAEPGGWDATGSTPSQEEVPCLQRVDFSVTQAAGAETTLDEIDVYGDTSPGVPSSIDTLWVVELSHLDIGFTKPPDDIEAFAKTHLDQVIQNLKTQPDYRFNIESSWWLLRWMERSTAGEIQEMADMLSQGRATLAAGYANLHSTLCTREELIHSISYAVDLGKQWGFPVRTYVQDDVPGSTFALPEILAKSGIQYYVGGMNTGFGGALLEPSHATRPFWWEGPDGSRVLAWLTYDSYAEGLGKYGMSFFDNLAAMHRALGQALPEQEALGYPHRNLMVMRGFDNHYQGLFVRDLVSRWNATYQTPKLKLASPEEFFTAVLDEIALKGWTIPVYRGDFGAAWTHVVPGEAHTQRWVAEARRDVQAAEAFAAAAAALGGAHPGQLLATAWRRILDVDEHSGAGAWPGYFTREEADRNNRLHQGYATEARDDASAALGSAFTELGTRIDLPDRNIVVWNAQDFPRTAPVRLVPPPGLLAGPFRLIDAARGSEIPYQIDVAANEILFIAEAVPPFGWKCYRILPGSPGITDPGDLSVSGNQVENSLYRVAIDGADGSVASLVHLPTGRELVDDGASFRFGQTASNTNIGVFFGVTPAAEPPGTASVRVLENGPVAASLEVTRDASPAREMVVRLYRGLDRVEIVSILDRDRMPYVPYSDGSRSYALSFPFSLRDFDFGTESPARFLKPVQDGFLRDATWAPLNSPGAVDAQDALGGLTICSPECVLSEWGGISFMVSSHRTGQALWFLRVKTRADETEYSDHTVGAIDAEPGTDPLYPFTVTLRAHASGEPDATARRTGFDFVDPLRASFTAGSRGALPAGGRSFFALNDSAGRLFTMRRSGDGAAFLLRIEELQGSARTVRLASLFTVQAATEIDFQENPLSPLTVLNNQVIVPLQAFGTTSIRLEAAANPEPVRLKAVKDRPGQAVVLTWDGGIGPFTLLRSRRKDISGDTDVLGSAIPTTGFSDAGILLDGQTYFYRVE